MTKIKMEMVHKLMQDIICKYTTDKQLNQSKDSSKLSLTIKYNHFFHLIIRLKIKKRIVLPK